MKSVQPKNMKKYNERLIIEYLLQTSTATKAEISEKTGMSITTVRTQLQALMNKEAVCTVGVPESIGGRPAEKYALTGSFAPFIYIDFGFESSKITVLSLTGESLVDETKPSIQLEETIFDLLNQYPQIELIELSVPGIPIEQGFIYGENLEQKKSYSFDFLMRIDTAISVEIFNDLNLCAFGQLQKYPTVEHLVYLSFSGCAGTGIIIDRKLYTGYQAFAGELGLLSYQGRVIDEWLSDSNDQKREEVIRYVLELISLTLSPQLIVISETQLSERQLSPVIEEVKERIWSDQEIVSIGAEEVHGKLGAHRQAIDHFMKKGWSEE